MKWFQRIESWCISPSLKEDEYTLRNTRFLLYSVFTILVTHLAFIILYLSIDYTAGFYVSLLSVVFLFAFLVILRITGSLLAVANLYSLSTILGVSLIAVTSGGITSTVIPFYLVAFLAILWIIPRPFLILWVSVILIALVGFFIFHLSGREYPLSFPEEHEFWFSSVNYLGFFAQLFIIFIQYRTTQDRAVDSMNEINRSLVNKQEELRVANEELREQHLNVQSAYSALKYTSDKINEQKEEILIKSRELQAANHKISQINASLNKIVEKRTVQLRKTNEELDQFLYRSSHDLRRPLTTILGLKHVAELTISDPMVLELFEKVTETAINMDKMLSKLITVSDINKTSLRAARINFGEMADKMRQRYSNSIETKNVQFQLKLAPKLDFRAPERLVEIVVEQLLENAINFSGTGRDDESYVRLEVATANSRGIIRVIDNGIGIEPSTKARLFEMYFKGTELSHGNGLGLYVAKKAAQKMMGTLTYIDTASDQTVFEMVVPMAVVV